jgi:hypothetical protein
MYETIVVQHRCGHEDVKKASACFKEPKSFDNRNGERIAGLKGLPALLSWCSFQSNLPFCSVRLCPDCRKERRKEARARRQPFESLGQAWRWYKEWTSSEDEKREERLREAERLKRVERRLNEMVDGW